MPLDKMSDSGQYAPTHHSRILHVDGHPIACIVDQSPENATSLLDISENPGKLRVSLIGFLNKHDELGLLMGLKLKVQYGTILLDYTTYPSCEFTDLVILDERVVIISGSDCKPLLPIERIMTDQFVKTKSEFDKFTKLMS